ncbi:MAG: MFS transporter [Bacteroidetes bacterium]|nr:MFS transporter [Bacteroidota bacterium]
MRRYLCSMKKTPLAIIFLITFIDLLGFGIVIPIIPSYAGSEFAASDVTVGFLVASFSFMQLIFTPIWGRLSDRLGRRPILILGLFLTVVSYVLFGLADSLVLLFASRLLGGIGGANISAAQAYIADVTQPHERAKGMGLIGAAFGLGFVFGPFIGGVLVPYGYDIPGYAAALLSAVALITAMIALPESLHARVKGTSATEFNLPMLMGALRRPKIGMLLILFFLITFGYANIYATFPMISVREFGFSDTQVGYLFGFIGIIGAITQGGLIRVLSTRYEERWLFLTGAALTSVGLALIPYTGSTVPLLLDLAVLSVGTGIMTPSSLSLISRHADERQQGGILGINQALGALARVLGPIWGAFAFQHVGIPWPFLTGGIVLLGVVILVRRTLW